MCSYYSDTYDKKSLNNKKKKNKIVKKIFKLLVVSLKIVTKFLKNFLLIFIFFLFLGNLTNFLNEVEVLDQK